MSRSSRYALSAMPSESPIPPHNLGPVVDGPLPASVRRSISGFQRSVVGVTRDGEQIGRRHAAGQARIGKLSSRTSRTLIEISSGETKSRDPVPVERHTDVGTSFSKSARKGQSSYPIARGAFGTTIVHVRLRVSHLQPLHSKTCEIRFDLHIYTLRP